MSKTCHTIKIMNVSGSGTDDFVVSGSIVGTTLVLAMGQGSTVNIPLSGVEQSIDFSNLSAIQVTALKASIQGDLVEDAFGVDLGYLIGL